MDATQQHAIRTHVRSLAVQLVPPSSPILASLPALLLPSPSRPLTPFVIGHDERKIDFWDARRVKEWDDERRRDELWEMTRAQADELKRSRKDWVEAVKHVKEEGEGVEGLPAPYTFPARLGDDIILPRVRQRAWTDRTTAFHPRSTVASLFGSPPTNLLPEPDEALTAIETVPDLDDAFDLKLSVTADQFADVKRIRSAYTSRAQLEEYLCEDEQAWLEELARVPASSIPRLGSPPIFPRSSLPALDPEALVKDPFGGLLPSERSDYPSSPRGAGISQEQWNKEEGLSSPPVSSLEPVHLGPPPPIWSSSPGKLDARRALELDPPLFHRLSQAALPAAPQLDVSRLVQLLQDDDPETDQLEPSDLEDGPFAQPARPASTTFPIFPSDDTFGDLDEQVHGASVARRIKPPKLSSPHDCLLASIAPTLSSFAAANASSSSWALAPLPGLRALTLDLSWRAWTLPAGETLKDVLIGGDDDVEVDDDDAELEGATEARETEMRDETAAVGEEDEQESITAILALLKDVEDGDDEELVPRVPVEVEQPVSKVVSPPSAASLDNRDAPETSYSANPLPTDDHALQSGALVELGYAAPPPVIDDLPSASPPGPAAAISAHRRSPIQSSSIPAPPDSSSSDFGFIFPPASSPSSPPGQRLSAGSSPDERVVELVDVEAVDMPLEHALAASATATSEEEPVARLEKAESSGPAWSSAAALDRFLTMRGRPVVAPVERELPAAHAAATIVDKPAPPSAHSSPPPGGIPFTLPPFLSEPVGPPTSPRHEPLRVVAFDTLLQMRPHLAALQRQSFLPVHRASRFPSDPHRILEPHLIVDPRSAILFLGLDALVSNVDRADEPMVGPLTRLESVMTTVGRLAARFDRLLVVLEEAVQRVGGVKRYSFTPPVLAALQQLASGLVKLAGGRHGVEVALSKVAGHSAMLVRRWADYLREKDEAAMAEEGLPVLELWGGRAWLSDDPAPDEVSLLNLADVNELAACAILAVCSAGDFYALSSEDRQAVFARILGEDRVNRMSASVSTFQGFLPMSPGSSSGFIDAPTVSISQLGALEEETAADEDFGQWAEWVDFDASQPS
ncbi:uncharacterized protein RHOBADRAFT_42961 [Rhodotorula graminis WP1]|uniref:Uncharacterized protein n=1 Tax=Rhodotorula graminis (strain WP1) TaxID=578459 RepID=A0A194S7P9_RHOGW|nr:uncharacterized protein RHOBADRAFT_42961 [Rhodotorula graminis WP1]KPV76617.1 hypothetical protein RHOBADRAFT_42961 [Rhodotorula graminis WP1]